MKKASSLLLALLLSVISFAGCSGSPASSAPTQPPSREAAPSSQPAPPSAAEPGPDAGGYPSREIQWIVPYAAGGGTDLPARVFQQYLDPALGGKTLITNMPGAAGTVGATELLHAEPDGYTIMSTVPSILIPYILGTIDFNYDNFEPICQYAVQSHGLVVRADSPYQTIGDLIEAAKANPGKINIGGSFNNVQQIALLELKNLSGADFNVAEIGNTSIKAPELLSGRVDAYIDAVSAFAQYIDSGEFRCIAIFSEERDDTFFPNVPTVKESGYDIVYDLSFGLLAPKGTPEEIVDALAAAAEKACADPGYAEGQAKLLTYPTYIGTEDYIKYLNETKDTLDVSVKNLMG